jgi:hypothetical protein
MAVAPSSLWSLFSCGSLIPSGSVFSARMFDDMLALVCTNRHESISDLFFLCIDADVLKLLRNRDMRLDVNQ